MANSRRDTTPTKDLRVTLTVGEGEGSVIYKLDPEAFRRVIVTANSALTHMKRVEGRGFPKVDQKALDIITELSFKHDGFI